MAVTAVLMVQTLVSAASIYTLFRAMTLRETHKSRYFLMLALAVVFYAAGYLLELDAGSTEAAYYAQRVQFFGVSYFAVFYYLFIRDYGNRPIRERWKIAALMVFPTVVMVLMNSYPESTLVFERIFLDPEPSPHLVIESGIVHNLHIWYSFGLVTLSLVEILAAYPGGTVEQRRQKLVFFCATLLPNLSIVVFAVDRLPVPMQFGSMSLVVSNLILGYYILRHRAEDWLPFARERIVEAMNDGYVLVDRQGRFLDANRVAIGYFPEMAGLAAGTPLRTVAGVPKELLEGGDSEDYEFSTTVDGELRYLQTSTTSILYNGEPVCSCILLYDVTAPHRLMAEMEVLATRDALTGLLNRGTFFRLALRDFQLAVRSEQAAALLMLDVDHFKHVNDSYGHQGGDVVLTGIARLLRERLRSTDIAGRYGGEEFCVFLPATDLPGALSMAEDIRAEVASTQFALRGASCQITISIGVAGLDPEHHAQLDDLIGAADSALYQAKNNGRNRVETATADARKVAKGPSL